MFTRFVTSRSSAVRPTAASYRLCGLSQSSKGRFADAHPKQPENAPTEEEVRGSGKVSQEAISRSGRMPIAHDLPA